MTDRIGLHLETRFRGWCRVREAPLVDSCGMNMDQESCYLAKAEEGTGSTLPRDKSAVPYQPMRGSSIQHQALVFNEQLDESHGRCSSDALDDDLWTRCAVQIPTALS